jgi:Amt family ammonium transporter
LRLASLLLLLLATSGLLLATSGEAWAQPDAPAEPEAPEVIAEQAAAEAEAAEEAVADAVFAPTVGPYELDTGSTAWMLVSCALVLLMVPGLALFYAGMVRSKNVLNTMFMCMVALGVVGVQWVVCGFAMVFGDPVLYLGPGGDGGYQSLLGWNWDYFFLKGIDPADMWIGDSQYAVPTLVFVMFQCKFAIITPALICGAVAERMKFSTYVVFVALWSTLVYCPVAHWVWNGNGWAFELGVLDFAGGTVVHVLAGISALVLILMLGKRIGYKQISILPNNLGLTMIGAGLLWFGWFGFNAGSAVAVSPEYFPVAGPVAGLAFANTATAAAAASLLWMLVEWLHLGKPTTLGFASGMIAGLVAITPAAGHVPVFSALIIGAAAGVICYIAVQSKHIVGYDDSLDVVGVHGVGGALGAILTGVFVYMPAGLAGLMVTGSFDQVTLQLIGLAAGIGYGIVGTFVIALVLQVTMGLRVAPEQEEAGLDKHAHNEAGYHLAG